MLDGLDQKKISEEINTKWLGKEVFYYPVVNSTNVLLKEMAFRGVSSGTLVITDYQQKGKGRYGRKWSAPPRTSLLFSLLFHPNWPSERANWLTMIAALAVSLAIEEYCLLSSQLKWPNDIGITGAKGWRKVGGILQEGHIENGSVRQVIIGIGINVNIGREDLPMVSNSASSLLIEKKRPVLRAPLLGSIMEKLELLYEQAHEGRSPQPLWNERLITVGQHVLIESLGTKASLSGLVEGTEPDGRLLLRDSNGLLHKINAGDVTIVG